MNDLPKFSSPILLPMLSVLMLAITAGAATAQNSQPMASVQLAQVTIEQRVIIRIPLVRPPMPPLSPGQRTALAPPMPDEPQDVPTFKEVKGPKCLKLDRLRGALINPVTGVTMVSDKDERFRTHFGRMCRAADFYSGFYIQPNKDGSICAGRDTLRARNGSSCDIERFAKLVPDD